MTELTDLGGERRWFLGTVGKTLGAAFGLAIVGAATPAFGQGTEQQSSGQRPGGHPRAQVTFRCCTDCSNCTGCSSCASGRTNYRCNPTSSGCSPYCLYCTTFVGACFNRTSGC